MWFPDDMHSSSNRDMWLYILSLIWTFIPISSTPPRPGVSLLNVPHRLIHQRFVLFHFTWARVSKMANVPRYMQKQTQSPFQGKQKTHLSLEIFQPLSSEISRNTWATSLQTPKGYSSLVACAGRGKGAEGGGARDLQQTIFWLYHYLTLWTSNCNWTIHTQVFSNYHIN